MYKVDRQGHREIHTMCSACVHCTPVHVHVKLMEECIKEENCEKHVHVHVHVHVSVSVKCTCTVHTCTMYMYIVHVQYMYTVSVPSQRLHQSASREQVSRPQRRPSAVPRCAGRRC